MNSRASRLIAAALVSASMASISPAAAQDRAAVQSAVDEVIQPLMLQHGIPGMAVRIVTGDGRYVFDYGVASKETGRPVTGDTLFEIGSVSKTFLATLVSLAGTKGDLALSDSAGDHVEALRGSSFDGVSLLNLATHTQGGLPLQVPDEVGNTDQLMQYFADWQPDAAPGTVRTYSNLSIGLLGLIVAEAAGGDYAALMQDRLFAELGLDRTYLDVPEAEKANYAQGYSKTDEPKRMAPGLLGPEAYGVRTTAGDLLRFVEANMGMLDLDATLQKAITDTHTGYFRVGAMTQGLVWESYSWPVALDDLVLGNSAQMSQAANPAVAIDPPLPPQGDVLINKTGSTNGFGAYVAFIPGRSLGIVLLANKFYPNEARVNAVHRILTRLDEHK